MGMVRVGTAFSSPILFHFLRVCYNQHRNGTFDAALWVYTGTCRTSTILPFPILETDGWGIYLNVGLQAKSGKIRLDAVSLAPYAGKCYRRSPAVRMTYYVVDGCSERTFNDDRSR